MNRPNLEKSVSKFKTKKILIVGDIILDKSIFGEAIKKSSEYPVKILKIKKETFLPGGAANTAANVASLGAQVCLVGVVGNDKVKDLLLKELQKRKINTSGVFVETGQPTIQAIRIIVNGKPILRLNRERKDLIGKDMEKKMLDSMRNKIKNTDAVIMATHTRGTVSKTIARTIMNQCNRHNKPVVVNAKSPSESYYQNSTLISLNYKEFTEINDLKEANTNDEIERLGIRLLKLYKSSVLVTREEKGMTMFEINGKISHIPSYTKTVFDVVGAGDTVTAVLALAISSGVNLSDSARLSSYAAAEVISRPNKRTISIEELKKVIACHSH